MPQVYKPCRGGGVSKKGRDRESWSLMDLRAFLPGFCVLFLWAHLAHGGPEASPTPTPSPTPGVLDQIHSATESRGVTISAEYTGEGMANVSGGIKTGATYEGLLKLGLTLDLQKRFNWNGATLYASALYPHGEGITQDYSGDFNVASSITAYNSFRLFELWFQQKLFDNKVSIRIGQMSADQEFFLPIGSAVFIDAAFGTMPTITFNNYLPIYPFGGLGIRVDYVPTDHWFSRAAIFDANPGIPNTTDKNGVAFHLNLRGGVIFLGEGGYTTGSSADSKSLPATYKIGAWYDTTQQQTPNIAGQHNSDSGLYATVDQTLFPKIAFGPGSLSGFFRVSAAPQQYKNVVPYYVDGGFNLVGPFPTRDKDLFGMALGYTKLSDVYMPVGTKIQTGHETVFETTYKIQVNDHLFVQPDIEYILEPGGYPHLNNALVLIVRFDFTY
jgi:porin